MKSMKHICIVEDNPDLREIFTTVFDTAAYSVQSAVDGQDALELLAHSRPDVLVLDVNMPRVSGLEVLEHVRQEPTLRDIRVVLVTGNTQVQGTPGTEQADLLLVKPVDIHELRTMVERLLVA